MKSLIQQLKERRLALGMKQKDMLLRIGISRQQYQFIESKGNPKLDTLELIATGLNSELMLIPKEKVNRVLEVLNTLQSQQHDDLSEDPWKGLLQDENE